MLVLMEMILNLLSFISRDGFGIGIFYCGLDRKIPKSRGSGSRFENLKKIPKEKSRKSRKLLKFFSRPSNYRDFSGFPENPRDSRFFSLGIFFQGYRIFLYFGIFSPGIFAISPGFMQNPWDSVFFGISYLRGRDFFWRDGIFRLKTTSA